MYKLLENDFLNEWLNDKSPVELSGNKNGNYQRLI